MKTLFYTACLLLVLSGYSQWQAFALQVVELARQQLPQPLAEFLSNKSSAYLQVTVPRLEQQISARLKETLQGLKSSDSLNKARVELKEVRFIPTNNSANPMAKSSENDANKIRRDDEAAEVMPATGSYVATINYDLLSPLTVESGATLLTAACSCGVAQVRLSDGFGVVKTFRCPNLRN